MSGNGLEGLSVAQEVALWRGEVVEVYRTEKPLRFCWLFRDIYGEMDGRQRPPPPTHYPSDVNALAEMAARGGDETARRLLLDGAALRRWALGFAREKAPQLFVPTLAEKLVPFLVTAAERALHQSWLVHGGCSFTTWLWRYTWRKAVHRFSADVDVLDLASWARTRPDTASDLSTSLAHLADEEAARFSEATLRDVATAKVIRRGGDTPLIRDWKVLLCRCDMLTFLEAPELTVAFLMQGVSASKFSEREGQPSRRQVARRLRELRERATAWAAGKGWAPKLVALAFPQETDGAPGPTRLEDIRGLAEKLRHMLAKEKRDAAKDGAETLRRHAERTHLAGTARKVGARSPGDADLEGEAA